MKPSDRLLTLLEILKKQSDETHIISMPELLAMMELEGFLCDRRTLYSDIKSLPEHGYPIIYTRKEKQGYYYMPILSTSEVFLLKDALETNASLSNKESKKLQEKLDQLTSPFQTSSYILDSSLQQKTDNTEVIHTIQILLQAIAQCRYVSFRYYDTMITQEKKYRKEKAQYHHVPYAIVSNNGRYYCVFYSDSHDNFAPYRIDKMEQVTIQEKAQSHPFQLKNWLASSFQMYKGNPQTITLRCVTSLSSILFDQFGKNMIISEVKEDSFLVNIKTTLTPTLKAWLLQFEQDIEIIHPQELKDDFLKLATSIQKKYKK